MRDIGLRTFRPVVFVVFAAAAMLLYAVAGPADDFEDPIIPGSSQSGILAFGPVIVHVTDIGGSSIDAKDSVEPLMTVLLTGDDTDTYTGMVTVTTQPTCQVSPADRRMRR